MMQQFGDSVHVLASLLVSDGCRNGPIVSLNITVKEETDCNQLSATIFIEKPKITCAKVEKCQAISSVIQEGNRLCEIGCQCAESANQCLIHLGNTINVETCEIVINM